MGEKLKLITPHQVHVVIVCVDARIETTVRVAICPEERIDGREEEEPVDVAASQWRRYDRAEIVPARKRFKSVVACTAYLTEEAGVAIANRVLVINARCGKEVASHNCSTWVCRIICIGIVHD